MAANEGRCNKCGTVNPRTATLCKNCMSRLPWAAAPETAKPRTQTPPPPAAPVANLPGSPPPVVGPRPQGALPTFVDTDPTIWQAYKRQIIAGGVLLVAACGAMWAYANYGGMLRYRVMGQSELTYTVLTRSALDGDLAHATAIETTIYVKNGKRRIDSTVPYLGEQLKVSELTLCKDKQQITVLPLLGLYAVDELDPATVQPTDGQNPGMASLQVGPQGTSCCGTVTKKPVFARVPGPRATSPFQLVSDTGPLRLAQATSESGAKTGRVKTTYDMEELGRDTIVDVPTIHYRLTTHRERTGCAGPLDVTEKMEVWVAPSLYVNFSCPPDARAKPTPTAASRATPTPFVTPTPYAVPEPAQTATPRPADTPDDGCRIDYEQSGTALSFSNAFRGLVMKLKLYKGDVVVREQEITRLSQDPIDRDVFDMSAYTRVSREELQQHQYAMWQKHQSLAATPAAPAP